MSKGWTGIKLSTTFQCKVTKCLKMLTIIYEIGLFKYYKFVVIVIVDVKR